MNIVKKTTMEAWVSVLAAILKNGRSFTDRDARTCCEIADLTLVVEDPAGDVAAPVERMQRFKTWVYPGKEELRNIIITQRDQSTLEYLYGPRLFNYQRQYNQIGEFIIPLLEEDPTSRRAVAMIYDPLVDSLITNKETPGLVLVQFRAVRGRLDLTAVIRSNDMFIGWPANIFQLHDLQRYVAERLSIPTGSITTFSISAHIYGDDREAIASVIAEANPKSI